MHTVLVSGSLAYDHIMDFPDFFRNHFLPDRLHNINVSFNVPNHAEHFGGTAGNIAYNLRLLGEDAGIIATAGNDFERYAAHLKEVGIEMKTIHHVPDLPTSFSYILTDRGDNQIAAFHPGAGGKAYAADLPAARLGIIAPGCLEDIHEFPAMYRKMQTPFFFDPGQVILALPEDDLKNGIEGADVVFANDYEFTVLSQRTGWQEFEMLRHAKTLVITLGDMGSRIVSRASEVRVPAVHAKNLVDPTGAGDAYRAGYAKGFLANLSPEKCARLGSTAAVYAVESVGTQAHRFTLDEFKKRYEASYGEACPV